MFAVRRWPESNKLLNKIHPGTPKQILPVRGDSWGTMRACRHSNAHSQERSTNTFITEEAQQETQWRNYKRDVLSVDIFPLAILRELSSIKKRKWGETNKINQSIQCFISWAIIPYFTIVVIQFEDDTAANVLRGWLMTGSTFINSFWLLQKSKDIYCRGTLWDDPKKQWKDSSLQPFTGFSYLLLSTLWLSYFVVTAKSSTSND